MAKTEHFIELEGLFNVCRTTNRPAVGETVRRRRRIHAGGAVLGWRTAARYRCTNSRTVRPVRHPGRYATLSDGIIELTADASVWDKILAAIPERFHNDVMANVMQGQGIERKANPVVFAQYFAAAARAIELLRPATDAGEAMAHDLQPEGTFSAPVGRYVQLELAGAKHRIYFEEAGTGIPVLLQHTAGCHSSQWRHLFETPAITDRFRLIAYDLPYHGKSLPPVEEDWWDKQYLLKGEFLRSVPLAPESGAELRSPRLCRMLCWRLACAGFGAQTRRRFSRGDFTGRRARRFPASSSTTPNCGTPRSTTNTRQD